VKNKLVGSLQEIVCLNKIQVVLAIKGTSEKMLWQFLQENVPTKNEQVSTRMTALYLRGH